MSHRFRLTLADQKLLALALWVVFTGSFSLSLISLHPGQNSPRVLGAINNSKLQFSPNSHTVNGGQPVTLSLTLNTDTSNIYGADVVIQYDSSKMTATNFTPNTSTNLKAFAPVVSADTGNYAFDLTKANKINSTTPANSRFEFGAVTFNYSTGAPTASYKGVLNPMASIGFTTKHPRQDTSFQVALLAANGVTTDSNIVDTDLDDVLGASNVNTATINVVASEVCRAALDPSDPIVNILDYSQLLSSFNKTGALPADVDNNGVVNISDLSIVTSKWGQVCAFDY